MQQGNAVPQMAEHAVHRGEIDPDCPALTFLPTMIVGAVIAHDLSVPRTPAPGALASSITAVVLPALGQAPSPAAATTVPGRWETYRTSAPPGTTGERPRR
ncbi:hypothetical protein WN71_020590 [Streptomyces mangrovisoli]|uniref:Tetracyclin repressor-like C-terminal domain-containing protein n=1 Tax=Streptomyces mangrovisoli TaxID=1428628 RepID=A0A1J4NUE6_9ACTN|nr:hypothetical protein WN71_020590 [Streptomyces mangrovisoli]